MTDLIPKENAIYYLWRLTLYTLIGMMLSQFISFGLIQILYPGMTSTTIFDITQNNPNAWHLIRFFQLLYQVLGFLIPALLVWKLFQKDINVFKTNQSVSSPLVFFIVPILLFTFFPLVQFFYQYNQNIEFFEPLHSILHQMEEQNNILIKGMLGEKSLMSIASNFILIAVVAAIIEEIFFRGVLQRILIQYIDPHLAIFISAVAFSAVHMQFLGFLPRLALGILFGYLFWRSNRLSLSIFVHFLFNGLQLLLYYIIPEEIKQKDIDEPIQFSILFTLSSTLLFFTLYYIFHKILTKKTAEEHGIK